jgi:hypothetical protein
LRTAFFYRKFRPAPASGTIFLKSKRRRRIIPQRLCRSDDNKLRAQRVTRINRKKTPLHPEYSSGEAALLPLRYPADSPSKTVKPVFCIGTSSLYFFAGCLSMCCKYKSERPLLVCHQTAALFRDILSY